MFASVCECVFHTIMPLFVLYCFVCFIEPIGSNGNKTDSDSDSHTRARARVRAYARTHIHTHTHTHEHARARPASDPCLHHQLADDKSCNQSHLDQCRPTRQSSCSPSEHHSTRGKGEKGRGTGQLEPSRGVASQFYRVEGQWDTNLLEELADFCWRHFLWRGRYERGRGRVGITWWPYDLRVSSHSHRDSCGSFLEFSPSGIVERAVVTKTSRQYFFMWPTELPFGVFRNNW